MSHPAPLSVLWWLVSRASGILALVLVSASVVLGLAMAGKVLRRPAVKRIIARLHEHLALIAIVAITVHGLALLGDHWLKPGLRGILVPFALAYRPSFTGLGIIAGYLAVLLGPSFYLRRRLGAKRWRKLHRFTVVVWGLGVVHTLGAGSDGGTLWLRAIVLVPLPVIVYLLVVRTIGSGARSAPIRSTTGRPAPGTTGSDAPRAVPGPARPSHRRPVPGQLEHEPSAAA